MNFLNKLRTLCAIGLIGLVTLVSPSTWAEESGKSDYRLGPGDAMRISVFQNPDLTLESRVSDTGSITYPLIGTVELGGLTVGAAEQKIATLLKEGGFVIDPQVSINLLVVRGNQISVLGQVNRPGRYPLELANTKLSDILALAGGVTPGGADTVVLVGTRNGAPVRQVIDIPAMFLDNKLDSDLPVFNGDVIYVHRSDMFYIYGEAQRPGSYRLERGMTLMQALAMGGGVTPRGTERGLKIFRRDGEGKVQRVELGMHDLVRPDDVIYVRESLF